MKKLAGKRGAPINGVRSLVVSAPKFQFYDDQITGSYLQLCGRASEVLPGLRRSPFSTSMLVQLNEKFSCFFRSPCEMTHKLDRKTRVSDTQKWSSCNCERDKKKNVPYDIDENTLPRWLLNVAPLIYTENHSDKKTAIAFHHTLKFSRQKLLGRSVTKCT